MIIEQIIWLKVSGKQINYFGEVSGDTVLLILLDPCVYLT